MEQYLPSPALAPYIRHFLFVETEQGMVNRILPDTAIVIAFRLRGTIGFGDAANVQTVPLSIISGIRKQPRLVDYGKNTANLLVVFKEGGAAAFFSQPLHELDSISVSLNSLLQRSKVQDIEEALATAITNRQRVGIAEQFLLAELKAPATDALVQEAIGQIKAQHGIVKIKDLLLQLPISRDPFEKRFRKATGTSPKHFAAIIRLQHLINSYATAASFTDVAYSAGYYDQAHFIKDFRLFTGQTPNDFFKTPQQW